MPATISQCIVNILTRYELSSRCVKFTGDSANVNFGRVSGKEDKNVFLFLKENLNRPIAGVRYLAYIPPQLP